jgi:hypothetical protein
MKRNVLIAALAVLGGIVSYLLSRRDSSNTFESVSETPAKKHHLTNAFSRAKQYATAAQ